MKIIGHWQWDLKSWRDLVQDVGFGGVVDRLSVYHTLSRAWPWLCRWIGTGIYLAWVWVCWNLHNWTKYPQEEDIAARAHVSPTPPMRPATLTNDYVVGVDHESEHGAPLHAWNNSADMEDNTPGYSTYQADMNFVPFSWTEESRVHSQVRHI